MELVIKTAPAVEPVSLAELKMHLRAESSTFATAMTPYQSIAPGSHDVAATYSLKGSGVDVLGLRALVLLISGANGSSATVNAKIQESDTDSDALYTDWTGGGFTAVTEANDNATQEIEYTGSLQYIRVVCTVATAACSFGVIVQVEAATHAESTLMEYIIVAAREYAEDFTGRALITQTWTGYLDKFPSNNYINMPKPPIISTDALPVSIKYRDHDYTGETGYDWNTVDTDDYIVDTTRWKPRIVLAHGSVWPSYTPYPASPIAIEFSCGYGAAASYVPESIRRAMLLYAATLYEFREDLIAGVSIQSLPISYTVNAMLWRYRVEA